MNSNMSNRKMLDAADLLLEVSIFDSKFDDVEKKRKSEISKPKAVAAVERELEEGEIVSDEEMIENEKTTTSSSKSSSSSSSSSVGNEAESNANHSNQLEVIPAQFSKPKGKFSFLLSSRTFCYNILVQLFSFNGEV